MSDQASIKLFPSNAIFRIALLKCVSGSILQKGCNQVGKLSIEKIMEIRKKYNPYVYGKLRLAKEYGVSKTLIHKILKK